LIKASYTAATFYESNPNVDLNSMSVKTS